MDSTSPCFSFPSDGDLLETIRTGSQAEQNQAGKCLDSHKQAFFNYIFKNADKARIEMHGLEMKKDLEDAYQQAILILIEHLQSDTKEFKLYEKASIKTYLFSVAERCYLNHIKTAIRQADLNEDYAELKALRKSEDLLETIIKKQRSAHVQQAIKDLDPDCAELMTLRYNELQAPREIATIKNKAANTISQQILRCRDKMKEILISKYAFMPGNI